MFYLGPYWGFPRWPSDKDSACQCRKHRRLRFSPWVRKIPWRRKWQHTPVFLPGKSHRQRNLVGYSPVQFSHSVVSNSLQPHGLQHARLPCPSPTSRACSYSYPLSQWCHPTISPSVHGYSPWGCKELDVLEWLSTIITEDYSQGDSLSASLRNFSKDISEEPGKIGVFVGKKYIIEHQKIADRKKTSDIFSREWL